LDRFLTVQKYHSENLSQILARFSKLDEISYKLDNMNSSFNANSNQIFEILAKICVLTFFGLAVSGAGYLFYQYFKSEHTLHDQGTKIYETTAKLENMQTEHLTSVDTKISEFLKKLGDTFAAKIESLDTQIKLLETVNTDSANTIIGTLSNHMNATDKVINTLITNSNTLEAQLNNVGSQLEIVLKQGNVNPMLEELSKVFVAEAPGVSVASYDPSSPYESFSTVFSDFTIPFFSFMLFFLLILSFLNSRKQFCRLFLFMLPSLTQYKEVYAMKQGVSFSEALKDSGVAMEESETLFSKTLKVSDDSKWRFNS
jgi:predicted PurR-regulated permease PerM